MTDKKIEELVGFALQNEDLCNYQIKREEYQTDTKEGFIGNIIFVEVRGRTKSGNSRTLNLVLKLPKEVEKLQEQRDAFLKEIFIYDKVKPVFEKTVAKNEFKNCLDFFPSCYATRVEENNELLVLENLRAENFKLWDKSVPLNKEHATLVLQRLGIWHSLSFALKMQQAEDFKDLSSQNVNTFSRIAIKSKWDFTMWMEFDSVRKMIFGKTSEDFVKLLQFTRDDFKYTFTDLFFEDPEHHVFLHGDCWNNNFMFKYGDNTNPLDVRIIDWQCSSLGSPVFDLSHFIYACCDNGKHHDVEEFLKIYYESFSKNLILCGCDNDQIFSYKTLMEHWKKYSRFGLFFSLLVIKISVVGRRGWDYYLERARDNLIHYCRNVQK